YPPGDVHGPFGAISQETIETMSQRNARDTELAPAVLGVDEMSSRHEHVARIPYDVDDLVDACEQLLREMVVPRRVRPEMRIGADVLVEVLNSATIHGYHAVVIRALSERLGVVGTCLVSEGRSRIPVDDVELRGFGKRQRPRLGNLVDRVVQDPRLSRNLRFIHQKPERSE